MDDTATLEPETDEFDGIDEIPDDDVPESDLSEPEIDPEFVIDPVVYEAPIPLDHDVFRPTELNLAAFDEMSFSEFARIGANLKTMGTGYQWWGGDWYNLGDDRWGEAMWQAMDDISYSTMANWSYVCRKIVPEIRREDVTFTVHKVIAQLPSKPSIIKALRLAAEEEWTVSAAEKYVRDFNGTAEKQAADKGPATSVAFTLSFLVSTDDEDTGDLIGATLNEALETAVGNHGVELLRLSPVEKTYNYGKLPE